MINIDFDLYKPSNLEQWISQYYMNNGILYPSDLNIETVASIFGVEIRYYEGPCFAEWEEEEDGYSFIFLNKNKHPYKLKNDFFHELCHPLRHVGQQDLLPVLFQELQEIQATQFQLVSAMPYYLLKQLSVERYLSDYIFSLSEAFGQPAVFVERRISQVVAKINQEQRQKELQKRMQIKPSGVSYMPTTIRILEQLQRQVAERSGKYLAKHQSSL